MRRGAARLSRTEERERKERTAGDRRKEGNCGSRIRASTREIPRLLSVNAQLFRALYPSSAGSVKSGGWYRAASTRIESRYPLEGSCCWTVVLCNVSLVSRYHTSHCAWKYVTCLLLLFILIKRIYVLRCRLILILIMLITADFLPRSKK